MCGRFVSSNTPEQIASYFGASFETEPLGENYNVAPTNDIYAVVEPTDAVDGKPVIRAFHWGLVPFWAKDVKVGSKMINARSETIAEKSVFKKLLESKRVLIPMDGYYEWQAMSGHKTKQPMFIHRQDGEPLAAAGLWTTWRDKQAGDDAPWLHSCTIITTASNETTSSVHDRMPVFLPATKWDAWLDPQNHDIDSLMQMLVPAPNELLTMHSVSTAVNNVRNKGAELLEPVTHALDVQATDAQNQPAQLPL
jgi:putative SOS response-associated peptidase YedK